MAIQIPDELDPRLHTTLLEEEEPLPDDLVQADRHQLRRKLPGEGELPLAQTITAALANNADVSIELEVFSEELLAMPPADAAARTADAVRVWRKSV